MATSLTVNNVKAIIDYNFVNSLTGSYNTSNQNVFSFASGSMANGTGATTTADLIYAVQTTISASGSSTLDLAGGLTDFFGNTITAARVKWMMFWVTNDTTGSSISIGNAASNQFVNWISSTTATVKVLNNGVLLLGSPGATGYAVTAGTGDNLKILNNDGSNTITLNTVLVMSSA